jgi:hypothetical protein
MGMFNDKRIEKLEERIRKLEVAQYIRSRLQTEQEWIGHGDYSMQFMRPRKIPLTEAIQVIADHLGLQFVYEDGRPERLTLQKPAKGK